MVYPTTPWTLKGSACQTVCRMPSNRVRSVIPAPLQLVEVLPGITIGTLYLGRYGAGSSLEYSELIVATPVRYGLKIGGWITHIYVDQVDSVAGGREIWGLPKELAQFTWEPGQCTVRQDDRLLCTLNYQPKTSRWQQQLNAPVFCQPQQALMTFQGQATFSPGFTRGKLMIPTESSFSSLNLSQPIVTICLENLTLIAAAPENL